MSCRRFFRRSKICICEQDERFYYGIVYNNNKKILKRKNNLTCDDKLLLYALRRRLCLIYCTIISSRYRIRKQNETMHFLHTNLIHTHKNDRKKSVNHQRKNIFKILSYSFYYTIIITSHVILKRYVRVIGKLIETPLTRPTILTSNISDKTSPSNN